jgi:hypothetical protein
VAGIKVCEKCDYSQQGLLASWARTVEEHIPTLSTARQRFAPLRERELQTAVVILQPTFKLHCATALNFCNPNVIALLPVKMKVCLVAILYPLKKV